METGLEDQFCRVVITDGKQPLQEVQQQRGGAAGRSESCSEEDRVRVAALMKEARGAVEEGHPRAALEILQRAARIQRTEKIEKRIAKLEAYLAENGSEDEDEDDDSMVHVGKGFYIYKDLYSKLYDYQKESLLWFWRLHRKNKGGILGDDMGLGKTVQVVAFMSGLFDLEQVSSVLIVVPVALVMNWEREFKNWAPGIHLSIFHGASKRERERQLERVQRKGGVLMVSYGLVLTCWEQLNRHHGAEFVWDYIILDEGHKIKNPTKTTKAVSAITAQHRFILTGTPIQNNLKELWSLFNFVTHGTLLGTLQTFKAEYDNPITRAREKDATSSEKLLGNEMAESLRLLIAPYFLRRTKADVLEKRQGGEGQAKGSETDSTPGGSVRSDGSLSPQCEIPSLTRKNDLIVWLSLTQTQIKIYQDFISLESVKELLMTRRSPLAELTILKKLCDHPRLLSKRACRQLGLEMSHDGHDENEDPNEMESAVHNIQAVSDEVLFQESGKLQFLVRLLANLRSEGHRCLVFSQSRKMLDIVEKVLKARHFKLMRLDGTITKLSEREDRIRRFQGNNSYSVFLLTTQVGGVGLTLTGADRVVIYDPSWNPATDNQAVDRVYRIGQTRSVVIYRLITCGTVEEKIYRRQIFKESLTKQTTGSSKNPYRYFTGQQLRELFVLDDPKTSQTQMQLEAMHAAQRKTDTELDSHIAFLYSVDIFGISDHDLMFSQEAHVEKNGDFEEEGAQYVQQRVQRAQELVAAESDLTRQLNDHIQRGTEAPGGGARKRFSMNINRDRLRSEWAEHTGEGVINPPLQDIPKYYQPDQRPLPKAQAVSGARDADVHVIDDDSDVEDECRVDDEGDPDDIHHTNVSSPADVEIANCDSHVDESNASIAAQGDEAALSASCGEWQSSSNQSVDLLGDGNAKEMDSPSFCDIGEDAPVEREEVVFEKSDREDSYMDVSLASFSAQAEECSLSGSSSQSPHRQVAKSPAAGDIEGMGLEDEASEQPLSDEENYVDVSVASFCAQAGDKRSATGSCQSPTYLTSDPASLANTSSIGSSPELDKGDREVREEGSDQSASDDENYVDVFVASFCAQAKECDASGRSQTPSTADSELDTKSPENSPKTLAQKRDTAVSDLDASARLVEDNGEVDKPSSTDLSKPLERPLRQLDLNATSRLLGLNSPSVDSDSPVVARGNRILTIASDGEDDDEMMSSTAFSQQSKSSGRTNSDDAGFSIRVEDSDDEMDRNEPSFSSPTKFGYEGTVIDESLSTEDSKLIAASDRDKSSEMSEAGDEEEEDDDDIIVKPKRAARRAIADSDEDDGGGGDAISKRAEMPCTKSSASSEELGVEAINSSQGEASEEDEDTERPDMHKKLRQVGVEKEEEEEEELEGEEEGFEEEEELGEEEELEEEQEEELEEEGEEERLGSFIVDDEEEDGELEHSGASEEDHSYSGEDDNKEFEEDDVASDEVTDEELDGEDDSAEEEDSEEELDREMREQYKALVQKGMSRLSEGNNKAALRAFLQALCIDGSSEKLQMVALKLKKRIDQEQA